MLIRVRPYLPTILLGLLIMYFLFHALAGDRGLINAGARERLLSTRRAELAEAQSQRAELERRASLLRDGQVSADLVEERARILLGYVKPEDLVVGPAG